MKITSLETLCLSRLHEPERQWATGRYRAIKADCLLVLIHTDEGHTDEGLTGIGEASTFTYPTQICGWIEWLSPLLVGKEPRDAARVLHPNGRSYAHDCAVAGIDCALWDLRGKIEDRGVHSLLTGTPASAKPDPVRLYASGGCRYDWRARSTPGSTLDTARGPEALIEDAVQYMEQGFSAMKFRLGTEWSWDEVTVDRFLGLVREVAQTVNGRMKLMIDGNQRLTEAQALQIARELARLGFAWFEEPLPQNDADGYARLNAAVDIPISGGEQFTTLEQYRPYFERGSFAIVQPDAGLCGLTECLRIAEAADRYGVGFAPHNWRNGLMTMANAHLVAALPNANILELCMIQGPLQWSILSDPPPIHGGTLNLADSPGFGVSLALDLKERFPYIEGHYAISVER